MRALCGRVHGDAIVIFGNGRGRVLFEREMVVALVEEMVLEDQVCVVKALLDLAKFQRDFFVYVAFIGIVVNLRFRRCERIGYTRDRG